jgi:hypothetical protein
MTKQCEHKRHYSSGKKTTINRGIRKRSKRKNLSSPKGLFESYDELLDRAIHSKDKAFKSDVIRYFDENNELPKSDYEDLNATLVGLRQSSAEVGGPLSSAPKFTERSEEELDKLASRFARGIIKEETYWKKLKELRPRLKRSQRAFGAGIKNPARKIWRESERDKIPPGSHVLGIRIRSPQMIFMAPETEREVVYPEEEGVISREEMVFVEITPEERAKATDQTKINKLAADLSDEVARELKMKHYRMVNK